jgi:uncharacterized Zn-binding protein involved in type VI secretion
MSHKPAARITDVTGHGASAAVAGALIGGGLGALAGAGIGAMVAGPAGAVVGAVVGAVAGAIAGALLALMDGALTRIGAPTVFIGGLKSARVTDQNDCPVPWFGHGTTPLVMGSATVYICGLPASRVDSKVACGAKVKKGCDTVLIGGPTLDFPDIRIEGTDAYMGQVQVALADIISVPDGMLWVRRYQATGKTMTIEDYPAADNAWHHGEAFGNSRIEWNPNFVYYGHQTDAAGNLTGYVYGYPHATLFHEMCHGLHHAEGTSGTGTTPVPSEPNQATEEAQTIGNGPYAGTHPTENSWRAQRGYSGARSDHHGTSVGSANPAIPVLR